MDTIVSKVLNSYLDEHGKIYIPPFGERVKMDVGTSGDAPNSNMWLQKERNLCVFGFEPNPINYYDLSQRYPHWINRQSLILIPTALDKKEPYYSEFYCVEANQGCSSLHRPLFERVPEYQKIHQVLFTPVLRLQDFFELFPWDRIPYIDHLKIDAQGADYDIVQGAGHYLKDKVALLSVEAGTGEDYAYDSQPEKMKAFLNKEGFQDYKMNEFNWTFINPKYQDQLKYINTEVTG